MKRRNAISVLAATTFFLGVSCVLMRAPAGACLHLPATYEGSISQSTQEGILFFDKGREELILKANYKIEGKSLPANFAWVITVPNVPDAYRIADPAIFSDTFNWAEKIARNSPRGAAANDAKPLSANLPLEVGLAIQVGPYEIQPLKARGKEGLAALNDWFKTNGFPPSSEEKLAYFVTGGFAFLAVRINPQADGFKGSATGALPPLQVSFATDRPYYPLKFFAMQGDMKLALYVFTGKKMDWKASSNVLTALNTNEREYHKNVPIEAAQFPKTLKAALAESKEGLDKSAAWNLNVVTGSKFNVNKGLLNWKSDLFLDLEN